MSVSEIGNGAAAAAKLAQDSQADNGQLFEAMAENARGEGTGMGAPELGDKFMNDMRGFVERNHDLGKFDFQHMVERPQSGAGPEKLGAVQKPPVTSALKSGDNTGAPTKSDDMDLALRSLDALNQSYERAVEVGLVSRGSTQASGAVRSLLRGQ